jgi:hypothetical protein
LFTDVPDAPVSACVSGLEELDPLALVEEPALSPPSSCENRFCRTPDEPVDAGAADPADDWLCAANSALIVAGDSGDNPFVLEAAAALAEAWVPLEGAKPVDCAEEDFGGISDWRVSIADDTAPKANSMTKLRHVPHHAAAQTFPSVNEQTPCHSEKHCKTLAFCASDDSTAPAMDAAGGKIFRLLGEFRPHCPRTLRMLRRKAFRTL